MSTQTHTGRRRNVFIGGRTLHDRYTNGPAAGWGGQGEGGKETTQEQIQGNNTDEPPHPPQNERHPSRASSRLIGVREAGDCADRGRGEKGRAGERGAKKEDERRGAQGETTRRAHHPPDVAQAASRPGTGAGARACGAGMNRGARGRRSTQGLTAAAGPVGAQRLRPAGSGPPPRARRRRGGSDRERDHGRSSTCPQQRVLTRLPGEASSSRRASWAGAGEGVGFRHSQIEKRSTGSNPLEARTPPVTVTVAVGDDGEERWRWGAARAHRLPVGGRHRAKGCGTRKA